MAGLAVGGVMAGLAAGKESELVGCVDAQCPNTSGNAATLADYDTFRAVSTVGFVAGSVLAATGVTLLVFTPKSGSTASVSPYIGGTTFGLRGAF